jgi:hypothetical protein
MILSDAEVTPKTQSSVRPAKEWNCGNFLSRRRAFEEKYEMTSVRMTEEETEGNEKWIWFRTLFYTLKRIVVHCYRKELKLFAYQGTSISEAVNHGFQSRVGSLNDPLQDVPRLVQH